MLKRILATLVFHRLLRGNFVNEAVGSTSPVPVVSKQPVVEKSILFYAIETSPGTDRWRKYRSRLF